MSSPIEIIMSNVAWVESSDAGDNSKNDLPHVTHSGTLEIMGAKFKCYKLSDGNTVFDADDVESFLWGAK